MLNWNIEYRVAAHELRAHMRRRKLFALDIACVMRLIQEIHRKFVCLNAHIPPIANLSILSDRPSLFKKLLSLDAFCGLLHTDNLCA